MSVREKGRATALRLRSCVCRTKGAFIYESFRKRETRLSRPGGFEMSVCEAGGLGGDGLLFVNGASPLSVQLRSAIGEASEEEEDEEEAEGGDGMVVSQRGADAWLDDVASILGKEGAFPERQQGWRFDPGDEAQVEGTGRAVVMIPGLLAWR